jgi:iron complex outermembrane receptor protein
MKLNAITLLLLSTAGIIAMPVLANDATENDIERIEVKGERQSIRLNLASTATRTDTPIEKIPQSIQVLSEQLLIQQDLQNLSDALNNVSGVTPTSSMQTVLMGPSVRGFTSTYYYDGLPAYQLPAGVSDPATLINVARIEVAKGPANTLYGGGSGAPLAGLINVVSKDPAAERGGDLVLRAGSFDTFGVQGRVDAPVSEQLGISLAGMFEDNGSHINEVRAERYALFPTLSFQASTDTQLILRGQINHLSQQEYSGLPAVLINKVPAETFAGAKDAPETSIDNQMWTFSVKHQFDASLKGDISVRHFRSEFAEFSTYPIAPVADASSIYMFGSGQVPSEVEQNFVTASLQKNLDLGGFNHQWLVGFDVDNTDYFGAMGLNFGWGMLDYAAQIPLQAFGETPAISDEQNDQLKTAAIFLQDQIKLTEQLDVTASLRYTKLDVQSSYTSMAVPLVNTDVSDDEVTPRIGATYQLGQGVAAFIGYAEGFKGVVAAFGVSEPKPETSQSYEAGLKLTEPFHGLTGSFVLFDITRQNVITADPATPFKSIQTGEQKAKGIELDAIWEPADSQLSLLASYAFTDATVTADNTLVVGQQLRAIPKHKGRLAVSYQFAGEFAPLRVGAGVTATSERELTLPNTLTVAGSAIVDAQAAWELGEEQITLSVQNMLNRDSFEPYQYFGGPYVAPVQPAAVTVSFRKHF